MSWQDAVIAVGQFCFVLALIPSVWGPNKPAHSTSLLTAVVLTVFVPTFWTLGLRWGPVMCAIAAALWWILFLQTRPIEATSSYQPRGGREGPGANKDPAYEPCGVPGDTSLTRAERRRARQQGWEKCGLVRCHKDRTCRHPSHVHCGAKK